MKFSDVFPQFELYDGVNYCELLITMDIWAASNLSTRDAVKYSRLKFEKSLRALKGLSPEKTVYAQYGTSTCPLCEKFLALPNREGVRCYECPIYKKTGEHGCAGTPYQNEITDANTVEEYIPALKHEIAFLREIEDTL